MKRGEVGIAGEASRRPLSVWELGELLKPMHKHRKGRQGKARYRKHFTPILGFVYRNRFAIASQIQRRFPEFLRSDRTTRRHLAEMESLGELGVAPTRSTSPLWPKVYHLTARGARRLRDALAKKGKRGHVIRLDRTRSGGYSADHVLHEILVTEFLLEARESVQQQTDLELLRMERRSLESHSAFRVHMRGKGSRLTPDGMFLYRQRGRGMMCCFVEVDTGTMSQAQLGQKLERYDAWSRSAIGREFLMGLYRNAGAKDPQPAFRILIIVGGHYDVDEEQRVLTVMEVASKFRLLRERIWCASVRDLQASSGQSVLDAKHWRRSASRKRRRAG